MYGIFVGFQRTFGGEQGAGVVAADGNADEQIEVSPEDVSAALQAVADTSGEDPGPTAEP